MAIEIERKFVLSGLPAELAQATGSPIRQGYLVIAADGTEARVRDKKGTFFLTIKSGGGLSRTEIEIELSAQQFDHLWPHTAGRRVVKTRYTLPLDGCIAEVDRFEGALDGLFVVEVEFPSEAASRAFAPPAWFGEEVTEDERYKNRCLAVHGKPERAGA